MNETQVTGGVGPSFFLVFDTDRFYPLTQSWKLFLRLGGTDTIQAITQYMEITYIYDIDLKSINKL